MPLPRGSRFPSFASIRPQPTAKDQPVLGVGSRVLVTCRGSGAGGVTLMDDAGTSAVATVREGVEVEILAWRPRRGADTRYRVIPTAGGTEGWLVGSNLERRQPPPAPKLLVPAKPAAKPVPAKLPSAKPVTAKPVLAKPVVAKPVVAKPAVTSADKPANGVKPATPPVRLAVPAKPHAPEARRAAVAKKPSRKPVRKPVMKASRRATKSKRSGAR